MIRSTVRYGKYMHYHLCPILSRETKSNLSWRSTIEVIDQSIHVFVLLVVPKLPLPPSVIGLVLFWAQMCCAVRTQWITPLS